MKKFENVDVLDALYTIMQQNTAFHQDDFQIDEDILHGAASGENPNGKSLLWFSHDSGTYCGPERLAFLKDSYPYESWNYYAEQDSGRVLAYSVEVSGMEGGHVKGDLYELDYQREMALIQETAVPIEAVKLTDRKGTEITVPIAEYEANPQRYAGMNALYEPGDPAALESLLRQRHEAREREARPYDLKTHIKELRDGLIYHEAVRLVAQIAERPKPDSLDKTFFTAGLSHSFTLLANSRDYDRLLVALPYRNRGKQFSRRPGHSGIYLYVHKDEARNQPAKNPPVRKPSVKSQLKAVTPTREAKPEQQKSKEMEL